MNDSLRQKLYLGSLGVLVIAAGSYFFTREGTTKEAKVSRPFTKIARVVPVEQKRIDRPRTGGAKPQSERRVGVRPDRPTPLKKGRPQQGRKKPKKDKPFWGA